jgi:hypothetical protein
MAATGKEVTGTRDTVYDLVSIIYHALQGDAQTARSSCSPVGLEGPRYPDLARFGFC